MYNKLFTKILDSSIWLEPSPTRVVWITLIASMDEDSFCHFSATENLARRAGVTNEECEKAILCFLEPDQNSGDPENDGRRIEKVPGGFLILNGPKYRDIYNRVRDREVTRIRVQRHRDKKTGGSNDEKDQPEITPAETNGNGKWHPTQEQVELNSLFNRKHTTKWSTAEMKALKAITPIDPQDIAALKRYYSASIPDATDYRRHDLATLLNNFNGEVDRAKNLKEIKVW